MFIRIGETLVSDDSISAVSPDLHEEGIIRVFLTSGKTVYVKASMADAESSLCAVGLLAASAPALSPEDVNVLEELHLELGRNYIAKDKTGAVYAFVLPPVKCGAYWQPREVDSQPAERIYSGDFDWLSYTDAAPTRIEDVLNACSTCTE